MHFIVASDYGDVPAGSVSSEKDPWSQCLTRWRDWSFFNDNRHRAEQRRPFSYCERTGNGAPYIIGIETFPYYYHRGHRLIPWYYNCPCSTNIRWSSTMTLIRPTVTGHLPSLFELDDVHSLSAPSNKYGYNDIITYVYFHWVKMSISIKLQEVYSGKNGDMLNRVILHYIIL